jgi:hypothetical protein
MERRHEEVGYADDVVPGGLILRILGGAVAFGIVLCVVAYLLLVAREAQLRPDGRYSDHDLPAPHAIAHVRAEPFELPLQRPSLREEQRGIVDSYGWVDKAHRVARIPVETEIDLIVRDPSLLGRK